MGNEANAIPSRTSQIRALDSLSKEIGNWASDKGFREDWEIAEALGQLGVALKDTDAGETTMESEAGETTTVAAFLVRAGEAMKINVIGMKLMLTTSELSEALETLRDHGTGVLNGLRGNLGEELADAHIRLLDLEHMVGSSPGTEVTTKVESNRHRPHKHGRQV